LLRVLKYTSIAMLLSFGAVAEEAKEHLINKQQDVLGTNFDLNSIPNNMTVLRDNYIKNNKTPDITIFVSFSMPKESLRTWLKEADKVNASVVIRGLVDNSFKATTKAVYDLVKDNDSQGVIIDPTLFEQFHINKVPAIVVTGADDNYDVVYGDITLDYGLRLIANKGEFGKEKASNALKTLRGVHD